MKKISIANDHGGLELKQAIMKHFKKEYEFIDCGTYSLDSCDYPDFAIKAGELVRDKKVDFGIVICKSGIGMSIAVNKVKGVRAAVCSDVATAHLVKEHNNANIIAFGARIVGSELAKDIVKAYLEAEFMGGRHQMRVDMISELEA